MANVTRRTAVLTGGAVLIGLSGAGLLARRMVMMEEEAPAPVFTRDGLAIRGIDPVAYFTEGAPVPGDPAHALDWNGATWRFASAENRARFDAAPERHAPRYGGFCAWAVAVKGELYSTQPENFTIFEDVDSTSTTTTTSRPGGRPTSRASSPRRTSAGPRSAPLPEPALSARAPARACPASSRARCGRSAPRHSRLRALPR